ncbi:MAG: metallophosphoesterase [Phormidesmis sp. RL_2_1]|nr:metallophosphoesterase [Phormidesmis sp. RL_2_1]
MPNVHTVRIPDAVERIALCGGPYSNFAAVEAFLKATETISSRFCLGDLGGFGPHPDLTLDLIRQAKIMCLQGNYDDAVGNGLQGCGCGYSDERDRHFAQVSYDYTYAHTSSEHREWMRSLPQHMRLEWRNCKILLCHGSPDQVNEFVWESESDDAKILDYLQRYDVDGICATHSGLPWIRQVPLQPADLQQQQPASRQGFWFNVGVLGRPANHGQRHVTYGLLVFSQDQATPLPQLVPLNYDVQATTDAMRAEGLPEEFAESLETGIWTTCAEILPAAEKASGQANRWVPVSS